MSNFGASITQLADLLHPPDHESDSDEDKPSGVGKMGPGQIGPATGGSNTKAKPSVYSKVKSESNDIWDAGEAPEGSEFEDLHDPRPQPEYDIMYKQAVSTEDMFLGMSAKTPATASCEDMIVKIQLPGTKIADAKLDVKDKFIDCRTPKFKLGLHLPHPVDSKNGKAQWDADKETLTVTLKITREYDFLNF